MATDILVPTLGESVSSATVARWLKKAGEQVAVDEPLVELETDKVTVEVPSPTAGVIESIAADEGAEVVPGAVLGVIGAAGAGAAARPAAAAPAPAPTPAPAAAAQPKVEEPRVPAGPVAVPGTPHAPLPAAAKMMA
ncbi:MAG: dihydrolipoamide succinyltransferase, partial [Acetobacteraceae bacterium]